MSSSLVSMGELYEPSPELVLVGGVGQEQVRGDHTLGVTLVESLQGGGGEPSHPIITPLDILPNQAGLNQRQGQKQTFPGWVFVSHRPSLTVWS